MALIIPASTLRRWQRRFGFASVVFTVVTVVAALSSFASFELMLAAVSVLLSIWGLSKVTMVSYRKISVLRFILIIVLMSIPLGFGYIAWRGLFRFSKLGSPSLEALAILISVAALSIALAGFVVTTYFAVRADRRAQKEHDWKQADRLAAICNPCAPKGQE